MRDTTPTQDHEQAALRAELAAIRGTAGWLPWTGLALALIWWAGVGVLVWFELGIDRLEAFGPAAVTATALLILLPGLLVILGASIAAENARAARANAIVLRAATQLVQPARAAAHDAQLLSNTASRAIAEIETAMRQSLKTLKTAATELADERLRIESVSYAAADNARDLTSRLTDERRALETLARELHAQYKALNEAIPRQAQLMIDSAKNAATEIQTADQALEARLGRLVTASDTLKRAVGEFDALAGDAASRQDRLAAEVARLRDELRKSREMTDEAVRASTMATQAARDTGIALKEAVAESIEKAYKASRDIRAGASAAAPSAPVSPALSPASAASTPPAARPASREPSVIVDDIFDMGSEADDEDDRLSAGAYNADLSIARPVIRRPGDSDTTDLFMSDDGAFEADDDNLASAIAAPTPTSRPMPDASLTGNGSSLRDILADIDRASANAAASTPASPPLPPAAVRHASNGHAAITDVGSSIVEELQSSGIRLPAVFRPRDSKRLMQAAKRGEDALRRTVLEIAGEDVKRVAIRLRKNGGLMDLAQNFMAQDADRIYSALTNARSGEETPLPRISAYLLIDAALNS